MNLRARLAIILVLVLLVVSMVALPVFAGGGGSVGTNGWEFCSQCEG